jgi:uncharacterized protein YwqG
MELSDIFSKISKTAITIDLGEATDEALPIGSSKIGGRPDMPKDFNWFYYEGTDFTDETKCRPLSFLAQINCEDVKKYDKDNLLPSKGMLYFFYDLATMTWGFDPKDKGSARVYYFNGDKTELSRIEFPDDLEDDYKLPEIAMHFSTKKDVPCYEEFNEIYSFDDWDKYDDVRVENGFEETESMGKLLGYADIIQDSMLLECERVTNGVYCGGGTDIEPEKLKLFQQNCSQWQLLFQLGTIELDGYELMFGDCGRIYFYIKKDDLKRCNFENCWLILQCG